MSYTAVAIPQTLDEIPSVIAPYGYPPLTTLHYLLEGVAMLPPDHPPETCAALADTRACLITPPWTSTTAGLIR